MFQEFYSKLSENEKKIFYAAILFGVLALFDMLFLRPFLSRIHDLDEEIVEKRNALGQDLRFLSYRDKILNEQVSLNVFETDEAKSEEEIIAGFLKTVELLASEAKINLSKITPADINKKKGVVEYFATLECDGKLENMMSFIHKIDETKNLLKVVKVDMSGSKTTADGLKVSMKIVKLIIDPKTIGNYPFKEEEAAEAAALEATSASKPQIFQKGKDSKGATGSHLNSGSGGKSASKSSSSGAGAGGSGNGDQPGSGKGAAGSGGVGEKGNGYSAGGGEGGGGNQGGRSGGGPGGGSGSGGTDQKGRVSGGSGGGNGAGVQGSGAGQGTSGGGEGGGGSGAGESAANEGGGGGGGNDGGAATGGGGTGGGGSSGGGGGSSPSGRSSGGGGGGGGSAAGQGGGSSGVGSDQGGESSGGVGNARVSGSVGGGKTFGGNSPGSPETQAEDLSLGRNNLTVKKKAENSRTSPEPETSKATQETPVDANKAKKSTALEDKLNKVGEGGRVRVESIESLWARFFGKKDATDQEQAEPPQEGDPNLWQKKLQGQ